MALKDTCNTLASLLQAIHSDLEKASEGNKAAAQRVRTLSIKFEKAAKLYRKESVQAGKSGAMKRMKKAGKKAAAPKTKTAAPKKSASKKATKSKGAAKKSAGKKSVAKKGVASAKKATSHRKSSARKRATAKLPAGGK